MTKININRIFISLLIIEIVFGGGGRILEPLGVPPLRYVFFFIALAFFVINAACKNIHINSDTAVIILALMGLPLYGSFIGSLNGSFTSDIAFDFQPYAYMLILIYICSLNKPNAEYSIDFFIKTVKVFSVSMSLVYICYIIMLRSGMINFAEFYQTLSLTSEVFFRPSGAFFAKSFFFIGIGAIFLFIEKRYFLFLLSMLAVFLTETRGVFLFTGISIIIANLRTGGAVKNALYISAAIAAGFALIAAVGDRAGDSDSVRLNDFEFILRDMSGFYSIFGHGFGAQVLDRGRIEVVPLELLYKTGAIGIVLSIIPIFALSIRVLVKSFTTKQLQIVCALLFAAGVSIT
ncbi:oligosaccharide repeat unit polymerase, partial [Escherichia coli]|nr:oligosaccharide repeat unit polymerase [Escherichia coli]